jgi:hypothetical protein
MSDLILPAPEPSAEPVLITPTDKGRELAQVPGTLLVVTGVLHTLAFAALTVLPTILTLVMLALSIASAIDPDLKEDSAPVVFLGFAGFCSAFGLANLVFMAISIWSTLMGGLHYRNLQSFRRARMACISALVLPLLALPFGMGSYVFGILILMPTVALGSVAGIMGMLYIFDEDVAQAFEYR